MKIRNTITKLFTITLAVAALAVISFAWTPGRTAGQVALGDGSVRFVSQSISFEPGQMIRFNVYHPISPEQQRTTFTGHVKIFDASGNVLARSQVIVLPPGQFHSFDLNRDDLQVAGEPGTGRIHVGADFQFQADAQPVLISPEHLLISAEIVETRTGKTIRTSFLSFPGFNGGVFVG